MAEFLRSTILPLAIRGIHHSDLWQMQALVTDRILPEGPD